MVKGLNIFKTHFRNHSDYFAIIGGTAASEWFAKEELPFRATKDIDIVLLIEALDKAFIRHFWDFIFQGNYEIKQRSDSRPVYYRFAKPKRDDFPEMLELFSRGPDNLILGDAQTIVPIPKGEAASSLSAILMDEDYYQVVHDFREISNGLPLITPPGIILLKAKAWLDLNMRAQSGEKVDSKHIKKHRNDVFRLTLLLPAGRSFEVSPNVQADLERFLSAFPEQSDEWKKIEAAVGKNPSFPSITDIIAALNGAFFSNR